MRSRVIQFKKIIFGCLSIFVIFTLLLTISMNTSAAGLNKSKATIYVGGSKLTLKLSGTTAKSWFSSNKKVATVTSRGEVTGLKAGSSTISCKGKNKRIYRCKITVKKPYLNASSQTLSVGASFTLKITGVKAKAFQSSKPSVATVTKRGKITAKKTGKTTITCIGADQKNYTCKLTVTKKGVLSSTQKSLHTGDCFTLSLSKATAKSFSSDDASIASVSKTGLVTANSPGTAKITVLDTAGLSYICTVTVEAHQLKTVGALPATCLYTGFTGDQICQICNQTIHTGAVIPTTAHQPVLEDQKEETCCEPGYTGRYRCSSCLTILEEGKEIPPSTSKHKYYKDGEQSIDATCSNAGILVEVCRRCKDTKKKTLPMTEHEYPSYLVEETFANCTEDGIRNEFCSRYQNCNSCITTVTKAYGHQMKWNPAHTELICDDCSLTFSLSIKAPVLNNRYMLSLHANHGFEFSISYADNKDLNSIYFYEKNKIIKDYWDHIRIEVDHPEILQPRPIVGSTLINATENVDYTEYHAIKGLKMGQASMRVYFYDILYGTYDFVIGGDFVRAIQALYGGSTLTEADTAGLSTYQVDVIRWIVDMLNSVITREMSDYNKILAIKEWYKENISYDHGGYRENDALVNIFYELKRLGVCEDYSESFALLMDVLGIPNYYVAGFAYETETNNQLDAHAWNMVYIDCHNGKGQQWYFADMTWNDFDPTFTVKELEQATKLKGKYLVEGSLQYRIATDFCKMDNRIYTNYMQPYDTERIKEGLYMDFSKFEYK